MTSPRMINLFTTISKNDFQHDISRVEFIGSWRIRIGPTYPTSVMTLRLAVMTSDSP